VITQDTIERVKNEANLVEVASETVKLRRAGMHYSGLCPFHAERSPSFFIRESSNSYICYGCGASGNVISFVMTTRAMTFPDAVEYLAGRFGIEVKRDSVKQAGPVVDKERLFAVLRTAHLYFRRCLLQVKSGTSAELRALSAYLSKRGLAAEAINEFGIGFCPSERGGLIGALQGAGFDTEVMLLSGLVRRSQSGALYELFRSRLVFPIHVDAKRIAGFGGRLVPGIGEQEDAPKYVNSPESPIYQKSRMLYGLPQAIGAMRTAGEVYVVEGYMDVVGLAMRGVRNVVACCGTAMTEQHLRRFSGLCNRVHLLFDGDGAGRSAAAKAFLAARNAPLDLSVCFLPDGLDPDDFARQYEDQVGAELKRLKREDPLDIFVDGVLARAGCAAEERPGPNLLGRLSDEVAKALSGIEHEVARVRLVARAARRLGVDSQQLEKLVGAGRQRGGAPGALGGGGAGAAGTTFSSAERGAGGARVAGGANGSAAGATAVAVGGQGGMQGRGQGGESSASPRVAPFPAEDLDILMAVMVLKGEIAPDFMANPEVCIGVQPATREFATEFHTILSEYAADEVRQRGAVKELLERRGGRWIGAWKEAYKRQQAGVDMRQLYMSALDSLRRQRLKGELAAVTAALAQLPAGDEGVRELMDQQRALKLQLSAPGR
jgi:DNA primase